MLRQFGWYHGPQTMPEPRLAVRSILIHLAIVAVFGVALPWYRGMEFWDPVMLAAYACFGLLFTAPAAAEAFSADRPVNFAEALIRIGKAILYGEGMALTILAAGLLTVYLTHRRLRLPPDLESLTQAALFGLAASLALAAVAAWISLQFSAGIARTALRIIFLGLLWVFFSYSRWLPDVAGRAALASVSVAAAALIAMRLALRSHQDSEQDF